MNNAPATANSSMRAPRWPLSEAKGAGKRREHNDVRELIPRRRNQAHGKRLRAEHEQPEQDAQRQQRGPVRRRRGDGSFAGNMSAETPMAMHTRSGQRRAFALRLLVWLPIIAGLIVLYVPSLVDLFRGIWSTDEQKHGPIVLAVACWLAYRKWPAMLKVSEQERTRPAAGRFSYLVCFSTFRPLAGTQPLEVGSVFLC